MARRVATDRDGRGARCSRIHVSRRSTDRRSRLSQRGAVASGAAAALRLRTSARHRAFAADSIDDSLLKRVLDRGKVIVGTGATNPPWHFEDENGKLVGMDIDMAKELAIGLFGIEEDPLANDDEHVRGLVEFVVQEANARIPNLLTDKVDVVIQFMTVTVNRATQVEFTIPYYREATTFLLPPDAPYSTIAEMQGQGLTIAVLQNVGVEESTLARSSPTRRSISIHRSPTRSPRWTRAEPMRPGSICPVASGSRPRRPASTSSPTATIRMTYAASVKPGDQIWLNFVNSSFHEAMVGINSKRYRASFKQWFGEDLPLPTVGFPLEFQ